MEGFNNLSRSVKGRVTLITGASSGMGKATALVFAAEGAKVIATDIDEENVTQLAKEINSSGGECIGIALDVTDKSIIKDNEDMSPKIYNNVTYLSYFPYNRGAHSNFWSFFNKILVIS